MEDQLQSGNGEPAGETATEAVPGSDPVEALVSERDQLAREKAELQDLLLRRQAEFENSRRRSERERMEFAEYAGMEMARSLLPTLDDFDRAVKAAATSENADKEFVKGFELIFQRLLDSLTKQGLEPVAALDQKFDPHVHHAVKKEETADAPEDTILEEYQRGYNFKGKLLRPAMVKVAVKP